MSRSFFPPIRITLHTWSELISFRPIFCSSSYFLCYFSSLSSLNFLSSSRYTSDTSRLAPNRNTGIQTDTDRETDTNRQTLSHIHRPPHPSHTVINPLLSPPTDKLSHPNPPHHLLIPHSLIQMWTQPHRSDLFPCGVTSSAFSTCATLSHANHRYTMLYEGLIAGVAQVCVAGSPVLDVICGERGCLKTHVGTMAECFISFLSCLKGLVLVCLFFVTCMFFF